MAKKSTKKTAAKNASAEPTRVKVRVEHGSGAEILYANYVEVSHSAYEFMLSVVRVPTKFPSSLLAEARTTGEIVVEPQVNILLPPTLIPGLIRALESQRDLYERNFGKLKTSDEQNG